MKQIALLFFLLLINTSFAQPFDCDGAFYLSMRDNSNPTIFYHIDFDENTDDLQFNLLSAGNAGHSINAVGFRVTDNYLYGISVQKLVRIDATGNANIISDLSGALDPDYGHWAGDITADGQYLYLLATGGTPYATRRMIKINLDDFSVITIPIPNADEMHLICGDISFDPTDGNLYGFDFNEHRLFKIDPVTAAVENDLFPPSSVAKTMGALFFDAFGNLYGYGEQHESDKPDSFFRIDKNTGLVTLISLGLESASLDGCTCPYNVGLQKSVYPKVTHPCGEVTYVFKMANKSALQQEAIDFLDEMPEALTITEIVRNPYGGNILSGIGTNILAIENLSIPQGVDSIIIKAEVSADAQGILKNQALLLNLPVGYGGETFSDDPTSLIIGDSTDLEVVPLFVDVQVDSSGLCDADSLLIIASTNDGLAIEWEDGTSDPARWVHPNNFYYVNVNSACEMASDTIYVESHSIQIDLGEDIILELGDSILLQPFISGTADLLWLDPLENSLSCLTCPEPVARPFFDVEYQLSGSDAFGCYDEDVIQIRVNKDRKVYIANIFSPNFDGTNDVFYIQGRGFGIVKTLKIFNRWGAVVFESEGGMVDDPAHGWDGTLKGKDLNPAVFVYYAEVEYLDGIVEVLAGDVMLVK